MWWTVVSLVMFWSSQTSAVDLPFSVNCKDEKNTDVDWYILYKAPMVGHLTGLEYIYIDSSEKRRLNDIKVVLANTLRPMLSSVRNMPDSIGFLSYSDQPPGCSATINKFGHSKGVVLGDSCSQTALWLTHSTPQFPFRRDRNNFYPDSGNRNGQTFMCVSLPFTELQTVGKHLQRIRAFPFDHDLPTGFPKELKDAANWEPEDNDLGVFQNLTTRGKRELRIMAKIIAKPPKNTSATAAEGDLYVQLARKLESDVNAQTWGCQREADKDYCEEKQKKVMNVESIQIPELGDWDKGRDHSKWAVTTDNNIHWTCIADMNRAPSQYQRSGGALCIEDSSINNLFKKYVKHTLPCGLPPKRPKLCDDPGEDYEIESLSDNFQEKLEL